MSKRTRRTQSTAHPAKRPGGLSRMRQLRDSGKLSAFQSAAGKKGYKVTMDRYGKAMVVEKIAAYRRVNPSNVEELGHELLDQLGITVRNDQYINDPVINNTRLSTDAYVEHIPFPGDNDRAYILDVAWPPLKIALEFDGPVHQIFNDPSRQRYADERQLELTDAGWYVFHISSDDLRTDYGASILAECVALVRERAGQTTSDESEVPY